MNDSNFVNELWQSLPPLEDRVRRSVKPDLAALGWTIGNENATSSSAVSAVDTLLPIIRGTDDNKIVALVDPKDVLPTPYEELREEMQKKVLDFYVQEKRVTNASYQLRKGQSLTDGHDCLIISTSATLLDENNCTAGSWNTAWILDTRQHTLQGVAKLHAHYYEDGNNIQMRATREYNVGAVEDPLVARAKAEAAKQAATEALAKSVANPKHKKWQTKAETNDQYDNYVKSWSESVAKQIMTWNNTLHSDLTQLLTNDLEPVVRNHVRRVLPITKQRMKWSDAAQRNVRLLRATVNKK
jgi:hypothetical protein